MRKDTQRVFKLLWDTHVFDEKTLEDTPQKDIKGRFVKGQRYNRSTEFKKGNIPPTYKDGRTLNKRCKDCGIRIDYKATRCMPCLSEIKKGKPLSKQTIAKLRILGETRRNPEGHKVKHSAGYILEKASTHRFADHEGYVREHRLVYERHFNCCLLEYAVIHHRNGKKDDNRIQNLQPMYNGVHVSEHVRTDTTNRRCSSCGSRKTGHYKRKFVISYAWYKDEKGGFICKNCYERLKRLGFQYPQSLDPYLT